MGHQSEAGQAEAKVFAREHRGGIVYAELEETAYTTVVHSVVSQPDSLRAEGIESLGAVLLNGLLATTCGELTRLTPSPQRDRSRQSFGTQQPVGADFADL